MRWIWPLDADRLNLSVLAILLFSVYLLVYTSMPASIDGADTLDVAATWVQHGTVAATRLTTPRQLIVSSADNPDAEYYLISADGERYSKKGVTPSLALLPFVAFAHLFPQISTNAAAMLLNPLITMATALLLYIFARRLDASPLIAFFNSSIFGVATFSIVYVKTLFGEPLAGLLLLVALHQAYCYQTDKRLTQIALLGLAVALAIGVNLTYIIMIVPFGVYALRGTKSARDYAAFFVPIFAMACFLAYWNWLRFGSPFETGYYLNNVEGFSTPILHGFSGLWLSFYKGFFWFNPQLLLSLFGIYLWRNSQRTLMIVGCSVIILQSLSYAAWWAWDGAWSWGPRFLIPIVPIMTLFLLPVIERATKQVMCRILVMLLLLVSIGLQLIGSLYSYIPFYETVYNGDLFNWRNHIGFAKIAGLFSASFEPALLRAGFDFWHLAAVIGFVICGLFVAIRLAGKIRLLLVIVLFFIVSMIVVLRQQAKPEYDFVRDWNTIFSDAGTAYLLSFEFDARLLDVDNGVRVIVTNPHAPQGLPEIQRQFAHAKSLSPVFYLVTWFPPASPENWIEQALWQTYPFVSEQYVANHRVLRFDIIDAPQADTVGGWQFGDMLLANYALQNTERGIYLTLEWEMLSMTDLNYSWFVHLLDANGSIIQQQDRTPQGGYQPTSTWQTNTPLIDRLFFPVVNDDRTGWQLRIGVINAETGEPVPVITSDGMRQLDANYLLLPASP